MALCGRLRIPEEMPGKAIGKDTASTGVETPGYWSLQSHETEAAEVCSRVELTFGVGVEVSLPEGMSRASLQHAAV